MKKTEIAKSSLLIQKEKELKELQKKKEKITKNIKTAKTKIEALQNDVETATKEMVNGMARMADLSKLGKELKRLLKELKKKVKLSRKDKEELNQVISDDILDDITDNVDNTFAQTGFGSAEGFEKGRFDNAEQFTDEFNRQRRQTMFEPYFVKPDEKEQQAIRKIYVTLAGRFHPDKAENDNELKLFNDLMQSINGAYQRGDMDELLDIQARFAEYKTTDAASSEYDIPILDVLDEQILRHRNDLNLLESQMLRLKTELNNLKNSDIGELVKQNKKAEKYGQGTTSDLSDGTQYMFDLLEEMKNIVMQWTETGKRPMVFNQFVDGSHPLIQKGQEQGMLDVNFDDEDFDGDGFEMSDEDIAEMLALLSMMEVGGAPKRKRRR